MRIIKNQVLTSGAPPHAHNLFIQTASDSGIIGIGLMLAFLTIFYMRAYKLFKFSGWEIRSTVFFVALSITCFLVDHMIGWNWPGPMFIYYFTFQNFPGMKFQSSTRVEKELNPVFRQVLFK